MRPDSPGKAAIPLWKRRQRMRALVRRAINLAIALVALFPILWGLSTSFKTTPELATFPPTLLPAHPTLEHYALLFRTGIERYMLNSVFLSAATVIGCLAFGSLAAYAMARVKFRGGNTLLLVIVALMSIPLPSLLVPTFTFLAQLGLLDSLTGLALLYIAYQLPIAVWVLYGYFLTIPIELEHAARVDGYSRFATLRKVILPLSGPGLVAAGLFVVTFAWNDFVVAVAMTSSDAVRTLPVAIYGYLGFYGREWGPLTASAILSTIPVIVVFIVFQRFFLGGMTSGGVKS
ncbi:carbohydrate ABC transporter permease [Chelatococcus asaccharovorans]|uniref:Carbohydrate ABC transporter membrane protein 2 (CUT1 family) n=1 Tax=Chelatococcus asaccharovorans TaxID=28210 RepID=A0A2V3UES3_9HYPH|nr:carbohydrate ABC transporter permease [Chelatococcus asaccharovorans]MBS7707315.1 carbohydrate ABC transporter permease [Chelatococcus asaccharovorans]PXW63497.1 carbohydrate ABC transporter membrane protein 2 (CUT1 family) [Chelatococcus asaccharovorans]